MNTFSCSLTITFNYDSETERYNLKIVLFYPKILNGVF